MGVAYYSNYFVWFEVGRADFCRAHGFSYREMEQNTHSFLAVAKASCRYRSSLQYDREFVVRTSLKKIAGRTVTFSYQLLGLENEVVHAEGETMHVVLDRQGKPKSFPEEYRRLLVEAVRKSGQETAGAVVGTDLLRHPA